MGASQRSVWVVAAIGICLAAAIYISLPKAVHPEDLEKSLQQACEKRGFTCSYQGLSLATFPSVRVVLQNPEIRSKSRPVFLKAEKIAIPLRFPEFLWGRYEPASAEVSKGEFSAEVGGDGTIVSLKDFTLKLSSIRRRSQMRFNIEGALQGVPKSLKGKGKLSVTQLEKWDPQGMFLEAVFQLKQFEPAAAFPLRESSDARIQSGKMDGEFKVAKPRESNSFNVTGKSSLRDFSYQIRHEGAWISAPSSTAEISLNVDWDFKTGEFLFHHSLFKLPFADVEATGSFFSTDHRFKSLHLSMPRLSLESIPQYYPPFKEGIPFNFGFSGTSSMEVSLEGKLEDAVLHATWDMTPALLTYAPYFSKPKDMALNFVSDFKIKDFQRLSGDFSLTFQEAVIKGAVSGLDFKSGEGELNIITNKFSLVGWDKLLLPLQNFAVAGDIKLLVNFSGNLLRDPSKIKTMLNLTLEKGALSRGSSRDIKDVMLTVDYAPISLEVKRFEFTAGGSPVSASIMVYHPLEEPAANVKINSPNLNPFEILETAGHLAPGAWPAPAAAAFQSLREFFGAGFPKAEGFKDLASEFEYKSGLWAMKNLQFGYCGGQTVWRGKYEPAAAKYDFETQIDRLSLARFFSDLASQAQGIDGNFFMTGKAEGPAAADWKSRISGDGVFSITQGAFPNLDVLAAVSQVNELGALGKYASGQTKFDDLRAAFKISEGKITTRKMDLMGQELNAKADGNISLTDGALNYRLDIFLPGNIVSDVLGGWDVSNEKGNGQPKQLGPIPFLLAGQLVRPELKADPELFPQFQENLQKRKTHKVLSNFLPEDFFLKRPTSS